VTYLKHRIGPEIQGNTEFFHTMFSKYGVVDNVSFFERDSRMVKVDMATLDDAILALIALDNLETHGHHLRVSFSKSYRRSSK